MQAQSDSGGRGKLIVSGFINAEDNKATEQKSEQTAPASFPGLVHHPKMGAASYTPPSGFESPTEGIARDKAQETLLVDAGCRAQLQRLSVASTLLRRQRRQSDWDAGWETSTVEAVEKYFRCDCAQVRSAHRLDCCEEHMTSFGSSIIHASKHTGFLNSEMDEYV